MERPLTARIRPGQPPMTFDEYERSGGWQAARKALGMAPSAVVQEVVDANLRGRGGAGFPAGKKWSFLPPSAPHPRYLVCNADEMEPGTFKDRYLMEGDPHGLIEAMVIAGWAIRASVGYIYVRWAYHDARHRLERAIEEARRAGWLGENILGTGWSYEVHVHCGAGRYIVGEETAMLNALEGRRAVPRAKPPYPLQVGLFGQPTVVQNVETLYNVPHIVERGAAWYHGLSRSPTEGGTKLYGVSGRVKRPGLWELPLGTTLGELIEEHAGGMADGYRFRGCMPGGASTAFLTDAHLGVSLDFASVQAVGSRLGTGTAIVLDDRTCPVAMCANLEVFFARESCGWCTPCRDGLPWTAKLLQAIDDGRGRPGDIDRLLKHGVLLGPGRTYCALAPGAMDPLQAALKYFREDFDRHVADGRCSYRQTPGVS